MENTNRHIFALNGIAGMLLATVLLLSILGALTFLGIGAQQSVMQKPYKLVDVSSVTEKSSVAEQKKVIVVKE